MNSELDHKLRKTLGSISIAMEAAREANRPEVYARLARVKSNVSEIYGENKETGMFSVSACADATEQATQARRTKNGYL